MTLEDELPRSVDAQYSSPLSYRKSIGWNNLPSQPTLD